MKTQYTQGYTLPELLIVLVIAGILGVSAVAGWVRWQQQQRLTETALQIQHFLHQLRAWANWHNSEQVLWLKPGERWCLGSGVMPDGACENGRRDQLIAPHADVQLLNITQGMGFYGKRSVARAGNIEFANGAGNWRIIVSARARIRLCKPEEQGNCQ
ncbi:prepilin peptidase-dependent protein [Erwiniaceae bacterium BAC15a-03b]|uniref:Prepilin peptidase-dependent protein n=1 Tax=Winslowiella arboricola TaxID=2978220 RepID=A0A9J6PNG4_9GAMM|nr:prepilin peptidase-dependent protein [Winslowiella arboricola]MCU5774651.1 prepilin peptidase-dependent protein [Winslowiella arboricola]MCU5777939.1 prepilin peptidase-dependent protein [Winslowiella arboricola]